MLYHVSFRYDEIGPDLLALVAGVSEMIYQTLEVWLYTVKSRIYFPPEPLAEDVKKYDPRGGRPEVGRATAVSSVQSSSD